MKRTAEAKIGHFFEEAPLRFHFRSNLRSARKAFHFIMGLVIVYVYMSGISRSSGVMILGSVLGLDLFLEGMRLRNPALNQNSCGSGDLFCAVMRLGR